MLNTAFNDAKKNMPASSAVDDGGVKNTIWAVNNESVHLIEDFMKDKAIYILLTVIIDMKQLSNTATLCVSRMAMYLAKRNLTTML